MEGGGAWQHRRCLGLTPSESMLNCRPVSPPAPLTHRPCTQILKNIKGAVDARVSVAHSATILANALMHAGTSIDTFLRENLEWLSRATNWAKFSATAGLGVIHRGQLQQGAWWWKRLGLLGAVLAAGSWVVIAGQLLRTGGSCSRLRGGGSAWGVWVCWPLSPGLFSRQLLRKALAWHSCCCLRARHAPIGAGRGRRARARMHVSFPSTPCEPCTPSTVRLEGTQAVEVDSSCLCAVVFGVLSAAAHAVNVLSGRLRLMPFVAHCRCFLQALLHSCCCMPVASLSLLQLAMR